MATYSQIQDHVRILGGRGVKTCWIAHVKSDYGLAKGQAPNRHDPKARVHPCPPEKRAVIEQALRELGMISN